MNPLFAESSPSIVNWSEFGLVGILLGVVVTGGTVVVRWFMARFDEREGQRQHQTERLVEVLQTSVADQTSAVDAFRKFEAEERELHGALMHSQDSQTQSISKIAQLQEKILEEQERTRDILRRLEEKLINV